MKSYAKILPRPTGTHEMNASFIGWLGNLYDYLDAGTYTPTLTNATNVAASTAYECNYLRIGNVVTVSGKVDIDPTAAAPTTTALSISVPIASTFANNQDCCGVANCHLINAQTGIITYVSLANAVQLQFSATDTANRSWYFTFTYEVI